MKFDHHAIPAADSAERIRPLRDAVVFAAIAVFLIAHAIVFAVLILRGSALSDEHERVEDLAARAAKSIAALTTQASDSDNPDWELSSILAQEQSVSSVRLYSLEGEETRTTQRRGNKLEEPILARVRLGLDEVEAKLPDLFRTPNSLVGYAPVHGARGSIDRIVAVEVDLAPIRSHVGWLLLGALVAMIAAGGATAALARLIYRVRFAAREQAIKLAQLQADDRKTADSIAEFIRQNPTPHLAFDGDEFIQANLAAARAFGADSTQAVLATPLWQFWPLRQPDQSISAEAWSEHVHRAINDSFAHFEWTFRRTDGSALEMDVFLSRATYEQREVLLLACYDLSRIREAQAQLVVSEQRFRDVSDAVGEFIWEVGLDGRYTFVSHRVQEVLGRSPEDVLGHHPFEWLPPDEPARTAQHSDEIVAQAKAFRNFEHRIRRSDGEILWVSASGVPRFDGDGSLIGYRGASLDITSRRQYEQEILLQKDAAEAAAQTKSAFLAMMSHEIRTPLNSVLGFADLILQTPLDDLQREYLDTIQRSGDALLILLNDILDFSKIESGRLAIEATATDIRRCLEDVVDLYLPISHARDVALTTDVAPDVPRHLRTDPARLRQILINLIGNAVKFTPAGRVTIQVTTAESSEESRVRFEVTDTGIGISEEKIRHLFQPFSQADTSTTRRFGGTGLGLAISKRLALLLNGDIGVADSSDAGSTFFLEIPLAVPTADEIASLTPPTSPPQKTNSARRPPLKILVVDDNPINRRLTTQLLKLLGDESDAVSSAEECFAAIEETRYDAILMDVQMPSLDGLEATRMIRERERSREVPTIPIVALTAGAMSDDREACFAAGMDFYLTKPIRRGALDETLRKISASS